MPHKFLLMITTLETTKPLNSARIEPRSYTSNDELAAAEERKRLKAVLEEVNVGKAGFLDVRELKTVCEHIGMKNLNEEVEEMMIFIKIVYSAHISFTHLNCGTYSIQ